MNNAAFDLSKVKRENILNEFNFRQVREDILGGITAAVVSLPLALAFGVASGAGAEAGLYGAIIIGFFAAIFGGTPTLISEPTGPMTVVMTAVIAGLIASNPEKGMAMAFTVVMLAGVFQIILGSLRLGRYLTMMPYSVISGFMSGIGVILIVFQLPNFLGQDASGSVASLVFQIPNMLANVDFKELTLGVSTLLVLFFTPKKIKRAVPAEIIALVFASLVALYVFDDNVNLIGDITFGLPTLYYPTFTAAELQTMFVSGLMLGALGCIDSLLTAVIADNLTRHDHKSDKELIGQGCANCISGIFGGLPGAGATMGTVVNIQLGARSAFSGVTRAVALTLMVVILADLVKYIPMAVLAAIAIKVGLNILDWSFVKRAHRVSFPAALVMYSVLLLTVFVDLIVAVGVGVFIANLITIRKLSEIQEKNIQLISDSDNQITLTQAERSLLQEANLHKHTLVVYLSGPMMFGVSRALRQKTKAIDSAQALVIDLSDVPLMDATVAVAVENMVLEATAKSIPTWIVSSSEKRTCTATAHLFEQCSTISSVKIVTSRLQAIKEVSELPKAELEAVEVALNEA